MMKLMINKNPTWVPIYTVGQVNLFQGVGIATMNEVRYVPGRNSNSKNEISLQTILAHDILFFSIFSVYFCRSVMNL